MSVVGQSRVLGQRRRKAGSRSQHPASLHPGRMGQAALLTHNLCNGTLFPVNICYAKIQPRQALLQGGMGSTPDSRPREHGPAACRAPAARPSAAPSFCMSGSEITADLNLFLRWALHKGQSPARGWLGQKATLLLASPSTPGTLRHRRLSGAWFSPVPAAESSSSQVQTPGCTSPSTGLSRQQLSRTWDPVGSGCIGGRCPPTAPAHWLWVTSPEC